MKITIDRKYKKSTYTISNMYIDGKWFCNTVEDTDRDLSNTMSPSYIRKVKDVNKNGKTDDCVTAIPRGTYKVTLDVVSPKFSKKPYYKKFCNGKVPRLLNVPGFDGILIHCGSSAKSSAGCIIVGHNKIKGGVTQSEEVFEALYKELQKDKDNLYITIK